MVWNLILAHLLADFPLQTKILFELKKRSIGGLILHSGVWVLLVIILVPHLLLLPKSLALFFVSHTFFDFVKLKITEKYPRLDNIVFFLIDQMFHIVVILIASNIWPQESIYSIFKVKCLLFYCLVGPASMTFLFYFKKLFYRYEIREVVSKKSWYGALERSVIFTLIILPFSFYFLIPFVLIGRGFFFKEEWDTALDLIISTMIATFCGIVFKLFLI